MRRDVVITGLGILSSAGANLAEAREKFILGTCCLTPITNPRAARLRAKFAGQIAGFKTGDELAGHDRHVHLALVAAREALNAAGVQPEKFGRRMGLIFSTCSGPMLLIEAHYERVIRGQPQLTAEELFAKRYYSGAQVMAQTLGIGGICTTVVTACSASTAAIALAADLIRCGMLDCALAGGADAFSISTLAGFDGLKATSEGKCAPFSKPPGLNLGEAAAFVFLESAEFARQRGAQPHATVLGSGMSNDAHHCSAPEPGGRGLSEAVRRALADAGLSPEQISYINAHGTGTEANDKAECKAIRKVFGERAATVPISSTKSMVGHCLGAAGAVEAIASIVCAEAGVLPPTANFTEPRDGCAVDCVPDAGRKWPAPQIFLSNNSAFGGHNTSLALRVENAERRSAPVLGRSNVWASEGIANFNAGQSLHIAAPEDGRAPVYITACGVVSAAGVGLDALETARRNGISGLRSISLPELPPLLAGRVDEAAVEAFDRRLNLRPMDRSSKWATLAARLAIRAAKFPEKPAALAELGLFLNLSAGPSWAESEFLTSFLGNDHQVSQLSAFPYIVPSSVAGNVCRALMLSGHNLTLNPGPAAGLFGLEPALAALRCGHAGALLCGAVDELSDRILADNFFAGQISAEHPPGEGAAVFMLETATHANARGAKPLAEICGLASAVKKNSPAAVLEEVVSAALQQAGIGRDDVGAVCFSVAPECARPRAQQLGQAESHGITESAEKNHSAAPGTGALLQELLSQPAWREKLVQTSAVSGSLEGAQPLLDLAAALHSPDLAAGDFILSLAVTPHGLAGAGLVRKL
jgi:3-oxoacyl-[acyl-carrier-protein] synthase II